MDAFDVHPTFPWHELTGAHMTHWVPLHSMSPAHVLTEVQRTLQSLTSPQSMLPPHVFAAVQATSHRCPSHARSLVQAPAAVHRIVQSPALQSTLLVHEDS